MKTDHGPKSILQPWVTELGLRYQGTLLTAIRGYDHWAKYRPEKPLIREIRGLILVPHDPRELTVLDGFMTAFPDPRAEDAFKIFCDNMDAVPIHYVMHVLHVMEVIAYCYPNPRVASAYLVRYEKLAHKFHLNPERPDQLEKRMDEDRVANGTVGL